MLQAVLWIRIGFIAGLHRFHCGSRIINIWKSYFLYHNFNLFIFRLSFMKDAQDTGEDFSPQKKTISTLKHKFLPFSYFLWVIFSLLDPDPANQKQCESWSGSTALVSCICFYDIFIYCISLQTINFRYRWYKESLTPLNQWYGESATLRINDARSLRRL